MNFDSIRHEGIDYSLGHLKPSFHSFAWVSKELKDLKFGVRVRYSSHCYSDKSLPYRAEAGVIYEQSARRMFCPIRYQHSLSLPEMFKALMERPVETVCLTYEDNWSIYRLQMPSSLRDGEIYYAFFRLKRDRFASTVTDTHRLDLYVESAYPRTTRVAIQARMPFGRVAERLIQ